jgi:NitT/TauT family transport system substrate-binding protein
MRRAFVLAAALLIAAGGAIPARAQTALVPLRIALIPTEIAAGAYYANDLGYFKAAGIDAQITSLQNGSAITAAVISGAMDIGFSNTLSLIVAHDKGLPVSVLVGTDVHRASDPTNGILEVLKASPVRGARDLTGKTVGVSSLSNTTFYALKNWIDKNGGDSKSVHFVELPNSEMSAALKQGRIDAAMLAEPALSQAKADVDVLGDAFGAIAPHWTVGVFVASKSWVEANPDVAHRFVQAMVETARWANTHRTDTAKILSPLLGVDPAVFTTMVRSTYDDVLSAQHLQPQLDVAYKYGQLKTPFDARQIVADAQPYWKGVR